MLACFEATQLDTMPKQICQVQEDVEACHADIKAIHLRQNKVENQMLQLLEKDKQANIRIDELDRSQKQFKELLEEIRTERANGKSSTPSSLAGGTSYQNFILGGSASSNANTAASNNQGPYVAKWVLLRGFAPLGCGADQKMQAPEYEKVGKEILELLPLQIKESVSLER